MATSILVSTRSTTCLIHDELTKPVVDPKVGNDVPHSQVRPSKVLANEDKNTDRYSKTEITQENELGVLGLVQWARWVKMVNAASETILFALATAFMLALMVVVASDVERDIQEPANKLLSNHMASGIEGSFFHQLRQLVGVVAIPRGIHFAGFGHKDHVTIDMTSRLVMFAVRDLPRKVRNQQGGMTDPAHRVVEHFRWRERLMPTLVRQYPQASTEQALHEGIHCPEHRPNWSGRDIFRSHIIVKDIESDGQRSNVSGDVCKTTSS